MSVALDLRLPAGLVETTVGPRTQTLDSRWLMAFAAALGEEDGRYFDTTASGGPLAHPLFAVCYEWPLALELRARAIGEAIARRGVHAGHHLVIHRLPRAGDRLTTTARVADVRAGRAGTLVVVAFETVDGAGRPVTSTRHGSIYRGVGTPIAEPGPVPPSQDRPLDDPGPRWEAPVSVPARMAHVYSECARIWNPIHTDLAVARAAGLPGPILHGTATLALAISRVVAHDLDGRAEHVATVSARFTGMVVPPCGITVRGRARRQEAVAFDAVDREGRPVLGHGALTTCSR